MTKSTLPFGQRRTVEIIEALRFGSVEHLLVSGGAPLLEPEPRIVQAVKLGSAPWPEPASTQSDLTLKKEFGILFDELARIRDGIVDIEVRHGLPFRLVTHRSVKECSAMSSSAPRVVDLTQIPPVPWAWVDEHVYAAIRGCSVKVLQNERRLSMGCPFRRINGTTIRYKLGDITAFIESQPGGGGAGAPRRTPRSGPGRPGKI